MKFYVDKEDGSEPQIIKMFVKDKDAAHFAFHVKGGGFVKILTYMELWQLRDGIDSMLKIMEVEQFREPTINKPEFRN
jgi:hypothetical protein